MVDTSNPLIAREHPSYARREPDCDRLPAIPSEVDFLYLLNMIPNGAHVATQYHRRPWRQDGLRHGSHPGADDRAVAGQQGEGLIIAAGLAPIGFAMPGCWCQAAPIAAFVQGWYCAGHQPETSRG